MSLDQLTGTQAAVRCRPLADRVLIKELNAPEKSLGGVYFPDNHEEKEQPRDAIVLAVGRGRFSRMEKYGEALVGGDRVPKFVPFYEPMEVKPGDHIRVSRAAGSDFRIGTEEYLIVHERDVLAIMEMDERPATS